MMLQQEKRPSDHRYFLWKIPVKATDKVVMVTGNCHKNVVMVTRYFYSRHQPIILLILPIICYAAVLKNFAYYAHNYAKNFLHFPCFVTF